MFIDPASLSDDPAKIEEVEKASARLVAQAIYEFRQTAAEIFSREKDLAQDIAEDGSPVPDDFIADSLVELRRRFGAVSSETRRIEGAVAARGPSVSGRADSCVRGRRGHPSEPRFLSSIQGTNADPVSASFDLDDQSLN